jgi:hypothetical protein
MFFIPCGPVPNHQQSGQAFAILSASGTVHTPHFDPNGQIMFLYVQEGYKLLAVGIYQGKLSKLLKFPDSSMDLWSLLRMPGLKIHIAVVGPDSLVWVFFFTCHLCYIFHATMSCRILPFGAVHAVVTMEERGMESRVALPGPTLMFGGSGFL